MLSVSTVAKYAAQLEQKLISFSSIRLAKALKKLTKVELHKFGGLEGRYQRKNKHWRDLKEDKAVVLRLNKSMVSYFISLVSSSGI